MARKVAYVINSLSHKRVIESFKPHSGLNQIIVAPRPKITTNLVPEDYSDLGIQNIHLFDNMAEAQSIVDKLKPDIVAQSSTFNISTTCKKVYIGHGMTGKHTMGMTKKGDSFKTWAGFDLYCGVSEVFSDWLTLAANVSKDKILLNALPQLDLTHYEGYRNQYKASVLSKTKPDATRTILFCGFCCKDRVDFNEHNEDYFKTAIELEKLATKNNWLVLMKPRQIFDEMMGFVARHGNLTQYAKPYRNIQSSKYLHFITTNSHLYRYYFADVIVCNGCSTTEIEACMMNKPLVIVRTKSKSSYDPYDTEKFNAAVMVQDINKLEDAINQPAHIKEQNELLQAWGILRDGLAYKRIQDKLEQL